MVWGGGDGWAVGVMTGSGVQPATTMIEIAIAKVAKPRAPSIV